MGLMGGVHTGKFYANKLLNAVPMLYTGSYCIFAAPSKTEVPILVSNDSLIHSVN